jgi:mono/diheme cytochrome c family protein
MRRPPKAVLLSTILLPGLLAFAGGWAVISLEEPPEFGVAGTPLLLTFAVRQHGITPLDDLRPVVEARSGKEAVRVNARAASGAGRYVASLTLSEPGTWDITIRSGFGNSKLSLLPLRVVPRGAAAPAPLGEADRGRLLFVAKGCVGCHVRNELGGAEEAPGIGPDLTGKRFEREFLTRWLADPSSMGPPRTRQGPMPNPSLKKGEISALSTYLTSAR